MELVLLKNPLTISAKTLKSLTNNFKEYTKKPVYSATDEQAYEESQAAADLINEAIQQISIAKEELKTLVAQVKRDYDKIQAPGEREDFSDALEKLEIETNFNGILGTATEMTYMLKTRLTEVMSHRNRMGRRLGLIPAELNTTANTQTSKNIEHELTDNEWISEDSNESPHKQLRDISEILESNVEEAPMEVQMANIVENDAINQDNNKFDAHYTQKGGRAIKSSSLNAQKEGEQRFFYNLGCNCDQLEQAARGPVGLFLLDMPGSLLAGVVQQDRFAVVVEGERQRVDELESSTPEGMDKMVSIALERAAAKEEDELGLAEYVMSDGPAHDSTFMRSQIVRFDMRLSDISDYGFLNLGGPEMVSNHKDNVQVSLCSWFFKGEGMDWLSKVAHIGRFEEADPSPEFNVFLDKILGNLCTLSASSIPDELRPVMTFYSAIAYSGIGKPLKAMTNFNLAAKGVTDQNKALLTALSPVGKTQEINLGDYYVMAFKSRR
ncbi:unnamed protein product [Cylicocyclus nassatus]|uniref:Uncharacterized protein n=1 Tax=Cylicocyclus nassatus TaxID=53992 RepID=A0AA36M4Q6_CYLNA|nr:unnamed protein product [Cylicocyclus nassatus]